MSDPEDVDWEPVRELAIRIEHGEPLVLNDEVTTAIRRTSPEVGISPAEAEQACQSTASAEALLREIKRRIDNGSHRLSRSLLRMYELRDSGDLEGARHQMRDVLAVEVVPHYRNIAQGQLRKLDDWEKERVGKP